MTFLFYSHLLSSRSRHPPQPYHPENPRARGPANDAIVCGVSGSKDLLLLLPLHSRIEESINTKERDRTKCGGEGAGTTERDRREQGPVRGPRGQVFVHGVLQAPENSHQEKKA
jgi:hypothetical protein